MARIQNTDDNEPHKSAGDWRRVLARRARWLVEPSASIIEPERRQQTRLLVAVLLVLFLAALLALIASLLGWFAQPGDSPAIVAGYLWINAGAVLLLGAEYVVSRTRRYRLAAWLAVATVPALTLLTALIDPTNAQLIYFLVLGGLMASLFLSALATAIVFAVTFLVAAFAPPITSSVDKAGSLNALFFILTVGALVIMAATLRQRYQEQIELQTQKLIESEAQLRELAIHDPLTGLFNRRYLEEVLALEMIRARRGQYTIGVLMADIDHFKQFNDAHGHAAGDEVLIEVAHLLRALVRSSDVTCRYGGEEFIVILPETSPGISLERAKQICAAAREMRVTLDGRMLESVTLSLGVAVFPQHGSTQDEILAAVDDALYRAKRDGRNRVVAAVAPGS